MDGLSFNGDLIGIVDRVRKGCVLDLVGAELVSPWMDPTRMEMIIVPMKRIDREGEDFMVGIFFERL